MLGFTVSPTDFLPRIFARTSLEDLKRAAEDFSLRGSLAYRAIIDLHYASCEAEIREDLSTECRTLESRWAETYRAKFGDEVLAGRDQDLSDWIRNRYLIHAFAGIAKHTKPGDVELSRTYLRKQVQDYQVTAYAVDVLQKYAIPSDLPLLLETVPKISSKSAADILVGLIVRLCATDMTVVTSLMSNENIHVRSSVATYLEGVPWSGIQPLVRDALDSESEPARQIATYLIVSKEERPTLEALLAQYVDRAQYYYNVPTYLDRVLYAPTLLRAETVAKLRLLATGNPVEN